MAGHSKWANIKHRKGAQDAKRGKIFTRIIKEISVAIKEGGSDLDSNPRLRSAIANAKGVNMPKDNIDRAIKKALGEGEKVYSEITFEGYGPNGVAIFVECTTNNTNRTVSNIRAIFNKGGGNLGKNGSLEFIFDRKGVFTIEKEKIPMDLEKLEMELIDSGLEELSTEDNLVMVYSEFEEFGKMQSKLETLSIQVQNAEIQRIPNITTPINIHSAKKILNLIDKFEDDDDVQNVFHNIELTDEIIDLLKN